MKRLKLKIVTITFKDNILKTFGGIKPIDHIETKMNCAGGKNFVLEIYYETFIEMAHVETFIFKADEILSIEQRWEG